MKNFYLILSMVCLYFIYWDTYVVPDTKDVVLDAVLAAWFYYDYVTYDYDYE